MEFSDHPKMGIQFLFYLEADGSMSNKPRKRQDSCKKRGGDKSILFRCLSFEEMNWLLNRTGLVLFEKPFALLL
jgi:hypothetical protein